MMNQFKAFLFDLNGTMIDDMDYHVRSWHRILNSLGAGISKEQAKAECYGKNHELIERIFPGRFSGAEKDRMSVEKEKQYQEEYRPSLTLLPGLMEFLIEAKKNNIKMAIGSAAIMFNIDFVLDGLAIRHYFDVIVSADDVSRSKPDPETYLKCASLLGMHPEDCLVFEDVPKGVESAYNAGMNAMVLTTMHGQHEFQQFDNILGFHDDYTAMT
jgi:HAD superfamily hydrolase (TIGR01509 family)